MYVELCAGKVEGSQNCVMVQNQ